MARRRSVTQPILGLVAPPSRPLSASRRELVRRAGTHLSIQQQQTARRAARAAEAEHATRRDAGVSDSGGINWPKLKRLR